jgi:hypothetical protein
MALTSTVQVKATVTETVAGDLQTTTAPLVLNAVVKMATGTATGLADRLFTDTRTLAASGTESLDLAGALTTPAGQTAVFVKLKAVIIRAAAGNTNDVQITRPASNGVPLFLAAGDGLALGPGGVFAWVSPGAGVTVTAATGDLLTVTNSAGSTGVTYDVVLIGTSA